MSVQAALVFAWPLFRDRTERAPGLGAWSLGWRAALLGLVAASVLAAAYRFIAVPSHHPMPEPTGQMSVLRHALREFWQLATHSPRWMSPSATLLAMLGALAMAIRRPLLLARVAVTVLGAFVALGRSIGPDELLGARYFLFTLAIFLIASGQGFEALLLPVPQRLRTVVAAAGIVLLGLWTGLAARTAYAARYAFQDEYAFARRALAALPAGCAVYEVPVRSDLFPNDLDCCLDLPRSPLVLDFPHLQFHHLPAAVTSVFDGTDCVAYYESIACEIADDPNDPLVHARAERTADYLHQRCAAVRTAGRLEPIAEATTSPRATVDFFRGKPPHAGLYRWTPAR